MPGRNTSDFQRSSATDVRRRAMAVLALAETGEIAARLAEIGPLPACDNIRAPEAGLVMMRGRVGGDGAAFNFGEATVSRAAVKLSSGEIGFGYSLGRDTEKARLIAVCDALLQTRAFASAIEAKIVAPLRDAQRERDAVMAARSAATRVEFFTLVRGED